MPDEFKAEHSEDTGVRDYLKRLFQLPDVKSGTRTPTRAMVTVGAVALLAGIMYSKDE